MSQLSFINNLVDFFQANSFQFHVSNYISIHFHWFFFVELQHSQFCNSTSVFYATMTFPCTIMEGGIDCFKVLKSPRPPSLLKATASSGSHDHPLGKPPEVGKLSYAVTVCYSERTQIQNRQGKRRIDQGPEELHFHCALPVEPCR